MTNARESYYRLVLGLPYDRCCGLPCFTFRGDSAASPLAVLVKRSLERAVADVSGPPELVRSVLGMSGQKYRVFINDLVRSHADARYLEIGSWRGSTAVAALYGNAVKAVCIDNWSQFGAPKEDFLDNMQRVQSPAIDFRFIEEDFRCIDYSSLGRFNIFLYDGYHSEMAQRDGIVLAQPALDESFVLIVDDWNWRRVRVGTFRAIRDADCSIVFAVEIRTTLDESHAVIHDDQSDWHNGYFIAIVSRPAG